MCNELEERLTETFIGTITDVDKDPIEITLYTEDNPHDIIHGAYTRSEMERAGIEIELYGEFEVDTWESADGRVRMELRPLIFRQLTQAEIDEIRAKVWRAFGGRDVTEDY